MGPNVLQAFLLALRHIDDRPIYSLIHRFGRLTGNVAAGFANRMKRKILRKVASEPMVGMLEDIRSHSMEAISPD